MITKKHYKAIAEILRKVTDKNQDMITTLWAVKEIAEKLTIFFKSDNPNFNKDKFLKAVGKQGGPNLHLTEYFAEAIAMEKEDRRKKERGTK